MTAPKEMGLGPDEVLLLEKHTYGEDEAPFIWYLSLRSTCVVLKGRVHSQDRAVFLFYETVNGREELWGHLIWHVDDFNGAGTWTWHRDVLAPLCKKYGVDVLKVLEDTQCGVHQVQDYDASEIALDQEDYGKRWSLRRQVAGGRRRLFGTSRRTTR